MFSKIVVLCAVAAVSQAAHTGHAHVTTSSHEIVHHEAPAHYTEAVIHQAHAASHHEDHQEHHHVDEYAYPKYKYSYSIEDPHSGDHKTQHETRDGDVVKGEYSLLQPDGSFRRVTYTADHHNGFHAVVHNTAPVSHHR